jgi:hypothetical protein
MQEFVLTGGEATTANSHTVNRDKFTGSTQEMHGVRSEILDAFVFANGHLASVPASIRAGRHTLLRGESLLMAFCLAPRIYDKLCS